jgi:hypothetical protein
MKPVLTVLLIIAGLYACIYFVAATSKNLTLLCMAVQGNRVGLDRALELCK